MIRMIIETFGFSLAIGGIIEATKLSNWTGK